MPSIVGEINRNGVAKVIKEEISGNKMNELITSIQAVKHAMNDLLSAIVEEEAGSSVTRKAQTENDPPVEEENSDEPAESDSDSHQKRQKL